MEHFKLIHYYCTEHNRSLPDEFCKLIGSDMQTITGVRNIGQLTKNLNSMAHVGCFILDLETFTENKENEIIDGLIAIRAFCDAKIVLLDLEKRTDETFEQILKENRILDCLIQELSGITGTLKELAGLSPDVPDPGNTMKTPMTELPKEEPGAVPPAPEKADSVPKPRKKRGKSKEEKTGTERQSPARLALPIEGIAESPSLSSTMEAENLQKKQEPSAEFIHSKTKPLRKEREPNTQTAEIFHTGSVPLQAKPQRRSVQIRKPEKAVHIGLCGSQEHIGVTHHAAAMALYLQRCGAKACVIEANSRKQDFRSLPDWLDGAKRSGGAVMFRHTAFYSGGADYTQLLHKGYQFYVYDYGCISETAAKDFFMKDVRVLVSGGKPWELSRYAGIYRELYGTGSITTILNFVPEEEREDLAGLFAKANLFFAEYAPSPFLPGANETLYQNILKQYLEAD